ncbi:MAG: hypothetical protein ACI8YQ_000929 [Polaribacter sp.]|jgi:hypothetical protein
MNLASWRSTNSVFFHRNDATSARFATLISRELYLVIDLFTNKIRLLLGADVYELSGLRNMALLRFVIFK